MEQANARALSRGHGERFSYRLGAAERMPFPDDSFDLTTCQTVLIHLRDPATALGEMLRVTRPGGLVVRALIEDARDRAARGFWNWSEAETRRFFLAGGGSERDFAAQFARGLAARQKVVEGVDAGTYHSVSGGGFFLSAGRKPARRG